MRYSTERSQRLSLFGFETSKNVIRLDPERLKTLKKSPQPAVVRRIRRYSKKVRGSNTRLARHLGDMVILRRPAR